MKLRTKLTAILLLLVAPPTLLTYRANRDSVDGTREVLAARVRRELEERVRHDFAEAVADARVDAEAVRREAETAVRLAAAVVRQAAAGPAPVFRGWDGPGRGAEQAWRLGSVPGVDRAEATVNRDAAALWRAAPLLEAAQRAGPAGGSGPGPRAMGGQMVAMRSGVWLWVGGGGDAADAPTAEGDEPRAAAWYQQAEASGAMGWSADWEGPLAAGKVPAAGTGAFMMVCAAPIFADDGSVIGVASARLPLRGVLWSLRPPGALGIDATLHAAALAGAAGPAPKAVSIAVAERAGDDGRPAWRDLTPPAALPAPGEVGEELARQMAAGEGGVVVSRGAGAGSAAGGAGGRRLWVHAPLGFGVHAVLTGPADVSLAAAQRVDEDFAALSRTLFRHAALAASLAAAAAVVVAYATARHVSGPAKRMAHAVRTLAAGGNVEPLRVRGRDELRKLADSFNEALRHLRPEGAAGGPPPQGSTVTAHGAAAETPAPDAGTGAAQ